MKKFLCFLLMVAVVATVSTTAFAATAATAATAGSGKKLDQKITALQAKQQKISDKKADQEANLAKLAAKQNLSLFKQDLNQNLQVVSTNEGNNLTALAEFAQLRLTLLQTLQSLKSSNQKLSDDTKTQLKSYNAQIKVIVSAIKDTKGQNKTLAEQNKINITNKDEAAINDTFVQISAIQTGRYDQIIQMNVILQQMNDLLN